MKVGIFPSRHTQVFFIRDRANISQLDIVLASVQKVVVIDRTNISQMVISC